MLGAKNKDSSSGCAVTISKFVAPCSEDGKILASPPTRYPISHCKNSGTTRRISVMRGIERHTRLESLLISLDAVGRSIGNGLNECVRKGMVKL